MCELKKVEVPHTLVVFI